MFQSLISTRVAIVFSIFSLGLSGCGNAPPTLIKGARGSNPDLSISSGNLVVREGKPGVFFGTTKVALGSEQFSYIIVFKHGALNGGASLPYKNESTVNGKKGSSTSAVAENGKTIQADYEIVLDDRNTVSTEQLTIGGKIVDLAAGRLFLIDLTSPTPVYEQKKSDRLSAIKSLETVQDLETVAASLLDTLNAVVPKDYY